MKALLLIFSVLLLSACELQEVANKPDDPNDQIQDPGPSHSDNDFEPRSLGVVNVTAANYDCPSGDPRKCYDLSITCEGVQDEITVMLLVDEPSSGYKGTITFHSGAGGKGLWAPDDKPHAQQVLADVKADGYRSVEVKWGNNGWLAGSDLREGITAMACRPATVLKWIHDNLYEEVVGNEAFCATGNSGGSVQVSLSMLNYGLDKYMDLVIPTAGPGLGRLDLGCMEEEGHPLFLMQQTSIFDKSYGFFTPGGPCSTKDESYLDRFIEDSQALGERDFYYPHTMVWNLVGEMDTGTVTNAQSQEVYNRWVDKGSPFVNREVIASAGHGVHDSEEGANRISEVLRAECRKH